jgi:hypothetical protein
MVAWRCSSELKLHQSASEPTCRSHNQTCQASKDVVFLQCVCTRPAVLTALPSAVYSISAITTMLSVEKKESCAPPDKKQRGNATFRLPPPPPREIIHSPALRTCRAAVVPVAWHLTPHLPAGAGFSGHCRVLQLVRVVLQRAGHVHCTAGPAEAPSNRITMGLASQRIAPSGEHEQVSRQVLLSRPWGQNECSC